MSASYALLGILGNQPSYGYYLTLGIALAVALGLMVITLPLLSRLAKPVSNNSFNVQGS